MPTVTETLCKKIGEKTQLPPILRAYLDEYILSVLETSWECGFGSDEEYLSAVEAIFVVQQQLNTLKRNYQTDLVRSPLDTWNNVAQGVTVLLEQMATIRKELTELVAEKLKLSAVKPRVVRVCEMLQLTEKEQTAFILVLLHHAGTALPNVDNTNYGYGSVIARLVGMSPKEWLHFISEGRTHLKQGLMEVDQLYRDTLSAAVLKMPTEVIAALVGADLTPAEALKVDKTVLADVLQQEKAEEAEKKAKESKTTKKETKESEDEASFMAELAELEKPGEDTEDPDTTTTVPIEDKEEEGSISSQVTDYVNDLEFDLYKYIKEDSKRDNHGNVVRDGDEEDFLGAYKSDVEYLDDVFKHLSILIKIRNTESDTKEDEGNSKSLVLKGERSNDQVMRELRGKERMMNAKIAKRLENTRTGSTWQPRIERLAAQRGLSHFEKMVLLLLTGAIMSHDVVIAIYSGYGARRTFGRDSTVGYVLWILCSSLQERITNRSYFYKSSTLVKDAMVKVSDTTSGSVCDLMECNIDVDRRMLDYIVGLDTEFNELLDGSHLYFSHVKLDHVILPDQQKEMVMSTISNYEKFCQCKKQIGMDALLTYGTGIIMLFYGPSGTGKTMLANGISNSLGCKLLTVNWIILNNSMDKCNDLLKYVFREAKLHNAIIFFDECENLFESRQKNNSSIVTALLTEIEKFDGLIILATNRAFDLDDAMNRRVTIAVEFSTPDHSLRKQIWMNHIPDKLQISDDIDFEELGMNFELSGGLIKNACLTAISIAVNREGGNVNPTVTMQDLVKGAQTQLRGSFQRDNVNSIDRKYQPQNGLSDIILDSSTRSKLQDIVKMDKGRKVLFTQSKWANSDVDKQGVLILLYGTTGCGKSNTAYCIAYECGYNVRIVNISELLSKYPSETYKNVDKIFRESKKTNSLIIFEDTERLFSYASSTGTTTTSRELIASLKYSLRFYTCMVIMIAQIASPDTYKCDEVFTFSYMINIPFPTYECRKQLWQKNIDRFAARSTGTPILVKTPKNIPKASQSEESENITNNTTDTPNATTDTSKENTENKTAVDEQTGSDTQNSDNKTSVDYLHSVHGVSYVRSQNNIDFCKHSINEECLEQLCNLHLSAADINHACLAASAQAALHPDHTLTGSMLVEAAKAVREKSQPNTAATMYN